MKLKTITVSKSKLNKITLKSVEGSYKSKEEGGEVTMTFELEEGEHLRSESDIAKEVNTRVIGALEDLMNKDSDREDWLKDPTKATNYYKEAK